MKKEYIKGYKRNRNTKIIDVIEKLFSHNYGSYETIDEVGKIVCTAGRNRSITAVVKIVKTYFPNATKERILKDYFEFILESCNDPNKKTRYLFYCPDIEQFVLGRTGGTSPIYLLYGTISNAPMRFNYPNVNSGEVSLMDFVTSVGIDPFEDSEEISFKYNNKYKHINKTFRKQKTQITDWLFLYNTIRQVIDDNLNIRLKIFYFTLEISKEEKMLSAFSNILYMKEGVRISPTELRSTKADNILPQEYLDLIKKYEPYFQKIEEVVTFIDSIKNPTGIYKFMRDYALNNGTQYKKTVDFVNNQTGEVFKQEIDDYYEADDPDEYVMCIVDHVSLIMPETLRGQRMNLHESIVKLSSDYMVTLRNKYNHIPVIVQQQSSA